MSQDTPPTQVPPLQSQSPPPASGGVPGVPPVRPSYAEPSRRRRRGAGSWMLTIMGVMMLLGSIFLNIILLVVLVASETDVSFSKGVLRPGEASQTVVVYDITGGIYDETVTRFSRFYDKIIRDGNVRAGSLRF